MPTSSTCSSTGPVVRVHQACARGQLQGTCQAIGRSRGGLSTKIVELGRMHWVNLVRFVLLPGQQS